MSDELEQLRRRHELHGELDELAVFGRIRDEMLDEPELALRLIGRARAARGVRNVAAVVVSQWKARARGLPAPLPAEPELAGEPPNLDAIEYAWSRQPNASADFVLRLAAIAITRAGGFALLRDQASEPGRRFTPAELGRPSAAP